MIVDPVLELRGVCKSYEGFSLRDISFTLPRGYIMGLIGPNGAGKTTLVKSILDLVRPEDGQVRVFGLDPREHGAEIRSRIGFVHESPTFYELLTVERAGALLGSFYARWDEVTFRGLVREFQLPPDKRLKTLSQGMRTRFALAVALSHGAELLLLDEASSGLDPAFRREMLDRLSGVIEGGEASVLFSSHITSDLDRIADYITFIRAGQVHFSTTKDEVLETHALVKGDMRMLDDALRKLLSGVVTGSFGFVGLTARAGDVRAALKGETAVIDPATLEDVVYYTGRTGGGGLRLHGNDA
jgi:ABC-2 type transport system ATP-binding protein